MQNDDNRHDTEEQALDAFQKTMDDKISVGEWVAVLYGDLWYPGLVEGVENENLDITFMARGGKHHWVWPVKEDRQCIKASDIMCKILIPPRPVSSRHFILPTEEDISVVYKSVC